MNPTSPGSRGTVSRLASDGSLFFFFQAEDGIRDLTVTGVQTCALPIYRRHGSPNRLTNLGEFDATEEKCPLSVQTHRGGTQRGKPTEAACNVQNSAKIGRASCRERV